MAEAVTHNNMTKGPRDLVVELIEKNISDPIIGSAEKRKWIYSRDPDVTSSSFKGYPYIIVRPSTVSFDEATQTGNRQIQSTSWGIEINIVTSDRGWNNQDAQGLIHMENICDPMIALFQSKETHDIMRTAGLGFPKPNATGVTIDPNAKELVYTQTILLGLAHKKKVF